MKKKNSYIGPSLTFFRKFFQVSPSELSKKTAIPLPEINQILNNGVEVSREKAKYIAECLHKDLTVEHLFKEERISLALMNTEVFQKRLADMTIEKIKEFFG
jgi:hypothetical protein